MSSTIWINELAERREYKTVAKVAKEAVGAGLTVKYSDDGYHGFLELSGRGPTITVTFPRSPSTGFRRFHNAKIDVPGGEAELIWSMKELSTRMSAMDGQER